MDPSRSKLAPLSSTQVQKILEANGVMITETQLHLLHHWEAMMKKINLHLNLVSRNDSHTLWEKHILHCSSLLIVRDIPQGIEVCDFGTGGGLPGMVLAILRPDLQVTLMDATQKKIQAVRSIVTALSLSNVYPVTGRGEELAKTPSYQRRFPVIVSRAVTSLDTLEKWTQELRQPNSVLHVYKGGDLTAEIQKVENRPSLLKIEQTRLALQGYSRFIHDEKKIVSLYFQGSQR